MTSTPNYMKDTVSSKNRNSGNRNSIRTNDTHNRTTRQGGNRGGRGGGGGLGARGGGGGGGRHRGAVPPPPPPPPRRRPAAAAAGGGGTGGGARLGGGGSNAGSITAFTDPAPRRNHLRTQQEEVQYQHHLDKLRRTAQRRNGEYSTKTLSECDRRLKKKYHSDKLHRQLTSRLIPTPWVDMAKLLWQAFYRHMTNNLVRNYFRPYEECIYFQQMQLELILPGCKGRTRAGLLRSIRRFNRQILAGARRFGRPGPLDRRQLLGRQQLRARIIRISQTANQNSQRAVQRNFQQRCVVNEIKLRVEADNKFNKLVLLAESGLLG